MYDKRGLVDLARGLVDLGWELVASGGSARAVREAGLPVTEVADVTGAPEILGGRVKTLHPAIHGGILARDIPTDQADLAAQNIAMFDLVVSNLYPFEETVAQPDVTLAEAIEQIDIGGVALQRAAAKNFVRVTILVDPADYAAVLAEISTGGTSAETRQRLAIKAFASTAGYDAAIANWLQREEQLPETIHLSLLRAQSLRYGENPHQQGARYRLQGQSGWWDGVEQHSGMALGYLNLYDSEAAWRLAHELSDGPAAAIIKHANPCGAAIAGSIEEAYRLAFACDPKSAFGGVVALNRPVTLALAEQIVANPKADVLIAPGYDDDALELLARKRKNTRVLTAPAPGAPGRILSAVDGGFLVQEPDPVASDPAVWQVVTQKQPTEAQWRDLVLANRVCARTKSNAIVVVKDGVAWGIGAGQQSRVDASELAARKAEGRAAGGAGASDAFFPFRDGLEAVAAAGVSCVIQPGGSIRDDDIIAAADELGLVMVLTGQRHFLH
ncbi:MAG: bifunctional phosphoribosylaminoimidazolecarboxamide formyltransferase/IMP cyclohydrolase [Anaerolineales bacterium]|nr:bifunctional phosphoribosylaminoimidazolecarboxamide formyltransferase/IMP cyclohydrolase [Anaerolineales bacterium]